MGTRQEELDAIERNKKILEKLEYFDELHDIVEKLEYIYKQLKATHTGHEEELWGKEFEIEDEE